MMPIDQTIEDLVADTGAVYLLPRPGVSFLIWAAVTLAATVLIASFSSLRPDLQLQLHEPVFVLEVVALFALIASTGVVAVWMSFPDMLQMPRIAVLPLVALALYIGCIIYRILHPDTETILPEDAENGMNCILCITLYSLVPGFWMFRTLRRHATTRPMLAGGISLLASASIGLLVLKFLEGNDSLLHLFEWHLIPIALFGVLGAFIGKRYLRW